MTELVTTFKKFISDPYEPVMYITGVAGTGKTTSLKELLEYCISSKIFAVTCAYTHKATGILKTKLPTPCEYNRICTLHSFLRKIPTINGDALKLAHVDNNAQTGAPQEVNVVFIDEFSMVGEKDYVDLNDIQYDEEGKIKTKIVYIGDPNQLPPVKDVQSVIPQGKYWVKLTKIYRQANGNQLLDVLHKLNDYINGIPAAPLEANNNFVKGINIIDKYMSSKKDKCILAYTNAKVQDINSSIEGKEKPDPDDNVFSPTTRFQYSYIEQIQDVNAIVTIRNEVLELNSKYKTLETLKNISGIEFAALQDQNEKETVRAYVFGHQRFLDLSKKLANEAVEINKEIRNKFNEDPTKWSKANWQHELAIKRGKAWAKYLAFKDCVLCLDFCHAMTVHKSQGSTYQEVYLDMDDLFKCSNTDYNLYLKLMYVGISRASETVYTN